MHSFEVDIRICQPENNNVHRGDAEVNITFEGLTNPDVNIRICQPENSDVHQGEAEVNITFEGLTNPDVNRKRMHQLFCYMTLSLFS